MFTGIVDHAGQLHSITTTSTGARFCVYTQFTDLQKGESIAVNGACLTVTDLLPQQFLCDLSLETLTKTHFGTLKVGDFVNLERALKAHDRLSGHFVTGHIDHCIRVKQVEPQGDCFVIQFEGISADHQPYLVPKGSVAINGISLTLNTIFSGGFSVTLIPHTTRITQLHTLKRGDRVNIEYDYLAKIVTQHRLHQKEAFQ
ncbi:MAG TPA: riboflavin synthase [Coxiellaceae bacterium]|nr:riboflavin synthase [Coxiellaceae bacterium]